MYDFPTNPTENQEFKPPVGGQVYIYKSPRWMVKGIPPTSVGEAPTDAKQYGRQSEQWTVIPTIPNWSTLAGKPATFPPTLPISWGDVSGKPATYPPTLPIPWSGISGIPGAFPPSDHNHYFLYNNGTYGVLDSAGNFSTTGGIWTASVTSSGRVQCNDFNSTYSVNFGNDLQSNSAHVCLGANSNYIYLRPYGVGNGTNEACLRTDGYFIAPVLYATSAITTPGTLNSSGGYSCGSNIWAAGQISGGTTLEARCPNYNAQNVHLWLKGPGGEDRAVIYTSGHANGTLYIRSNGGSAIGVTNGGSLSLPGSLTVTGTVNCDRYVSATNANIVAAANGIVYARPIDQNSGTAQCYFSSSNAYKTGGGSWAASSDERIKTVRGSYDSGLDSILALEPVRYVYKNNETAPGERATSNDKEYIGLVAQQAEGPMPELVIQEEGYIDGKKVTDLRKLDASPLTYAFINAFKEIAARLTALETRGIPA